MDLTDVSVVISDIDYTLVDFGRGHQAAIETLASIFGRHFANEVSRMFHLVLEGLRKAEDRDWEERQAFQDMLDQIKRLQSSLLATYGVKPWSREAWMIIAAQSLQLSLTSEQVEAGRDTYWYTLSKNATPYDDTHELLEGLSKAGIPLVLMTSSDSICRVTEEHSVRYDPMHSE